MTEVLSTEVELQAAYRDQAVAEQYVEQRFTSELWRLLHDRQVATVNRIIAAQRPRRVMEIAPGPGRVTRDVEPVEDLVCLEFNEAMIAQGKAASRAGIRWMQGNAFELPFENEFEFIYSFRFVRHFRRSDRERLYAQIRKALRPGGWLVLDAVNERVSRPLRDARPDAYPVYDKLYADEGELYEELRSAGLLVEACVGAQCWFTAQYWAQVFVSPRSRHACRWLIRAMERVGRSPLEWIVTCRRA